MKDLTKLQGKIDELVKEFGTLGPGGYDKLAHLAKQANENSEKLKTALNGLQESLDFLRICIKYQLFDLEATKRENNHLKKLLGEKDSW